MNILGVVAAFTPMASARRPGLLVDVIRENLGLKVKDFVAAPRMLTKIETLCVSRCYNSHDSREAVREGPAGSAGYLHHPFPPVQRAPPPPTGRPPETHF